MLLELNISKWDDFNIIIEYFEIIVIIILMVNFITDNEILKARTVARS